MRILSIQIGKVVTEGDPKTRDVTKRWWSSAFDKRPVDGTVSVGKLGVTGDEVADRKHHGGVDKAILCYAAAHYPKWLQEHPELGMGPGALGENLTIEDQDETSVCIGDRYQVGDCEIEISQPRQPCWKIARRWGVKTLTKEVAQNGRSGWYARVLHDGSLTAGDSLNLLSRPHPQWPVARANNVMLGREVDRMAVTELMNLAPLAQAWKDDLA